MELDLNIGDFPDIGDRVSTMKLDIKTREDPTEIMSIEELLENRIEEVSNCKQNQTILLEDRIKLDEVLKEKYKNKDDYNNHDIMDKFDKEKDIKYVIEVEDKDGNIIDKAGIELSGMFESDPPILTFDDKTSNFKLPFDNSIHSIIFNIIVSGKEYRYKYKNSRDYVSYTFKDERFDEFTDKLLRDKSYRSERKFLKFTIEEEKDNKKINFDYLLFANYGESLIFREGKFKMIKDELYNEMYPKNEKISN